MNLWKSEILSFIESTTALDLNSYPIKTVALRISVGTIALQVIYLFSNFVSTHHKNRSFTDNICYWIGLTRPANSSNWSWLYNRGDFSPSIYMILGPSATRVSSSKTCGCVVDAKDNRGILRAIVQSHDCDASKYIACEVPRKFFVCHALMGEHVCLLNFTLI